LQKAAPTSKNKVLSQVPRLDTYDKSHGSGNPLLQLGELQKIWHPANQPAKPKK